MREGRAVREGRRRIFLPAEFWRGKKKQCKGNDGKINNICKKRIKIKRCIFVDSNSYATPP